MTSARIERVLLEYDGPQLLLVRDAVDSAWLCLAHARDASGDAFACVPVSATRLAALRLGDLDLRAVFAAPEIDRRAVLRIPAEWEPGEPLVLESVPAFEESWLPDEGFYLSLLGAAVGEAERDIVAEAAKRSRPVVQLNLNPPETAGGETQIDAYTLSDALALFQDAVKRAHGLVTRKMTPSKRKLVSASEYFTFQVFGFAPGSFEVHLQAKSVPTLWGETPHVEALAMLDEFTAQVESPDAAIRFAQEHRGHFVSAARALLHFVAETKTPVTYRWTDPVTARVRSQTIRPEPAEVLYNALAAKQDLTEQSVTLLGVFSKVDAESGKWRMLTAEGDFSGGISPQSGVTLAGVIILSRYYRVECNERLEEGVVSGRHTTLLEIVRQPLELEADDLLE